MSTAAANQSAKALARENAELRKEVRVARRASEITAQLVAEQFSRIEEILLRLEEKARAEQELGRKLAEKLREAEAREAELARERHTLEKMQIASINMMEDITAARTAAEAATAAKSEFLANMSHEIRTPMTAIMGFANLIREETSCCAQCPAYSSCMLRAKNRSNIETICRNGEHLLQIINDILDISKVEAGRLVLEKIHCSPIALVADIQSLMQVRADAKDLSFTVEYTGPVPESVQSDPTRLKQILVNVIGNAVKFTEAGGVRLKASFVNSPEMRRHRGDGAAGDKTAKPAGSDVSGPYLQFDVVDTGLGMTEEQVSRLFQPFVQADASTTRNYGGTGLGLMISKRLAQMLGGDITVAESAPGAGTRFRITVATGPLDGVKMIDDPVSATMMAPDATSTVLDTDPTPLLAYHILLAEDGPDNQRLISHVLSKAGAEVTVVENGQLAVDAALAATNGRRAGDPQQPFDVILMDMQMPVMDGYEAAGLLRRVGYTGYIVALTAHAMAGDREKCIQAGCDDYATKPINRTKLIDTIRKHGGSEPTPGDGNGHAPDNQDVANILVSELAGDPDMADLVEMFVAELPGKLAAIVKTLIDNDLDALGRLAHQLKGAAGGHGFPAITHVARELETGVSARWNRDDLEREVRKLTELCRRARASAAKS